jgi:heat shock protein HslJ
MGGVMKTEIVRKLLALASVAITLASITSALTFAVGQKTSAGNPLTGTSWQLVKFQGPDERTFAPDDRSKYTIKFGSDGRVMVRVDCNRGSSTWRVTAKGELQFGSWSRTSAKCPPGSLHDQIVTEGAAVQNFAIKDGHLFLSGMEAGGYYELESIPAKR